MGELAYAFNVRVVEVWFTPIMWTGFILSADGWVFQLRGESWLTTRRRSFGLLLLISVAVWLLFEVYNFHLQNWLYRGVPFNPFWRDVAYFWSFATIMPAVFLASEISMELLKRTGLQDVFSWRLEYSGSKRLWFVLGAAMVLIPPAVPLPWARFLFGFVWLGWIPLLDSINDEFGSPSFRGQWQNSNWLPTLGLLIGGFMCGLLWETWNFQAAIAGGGHWIYTVPEPLRVFGWHFGKMPFLGLLGFPPFAMELWAFYVFLIRMLGGCRFLEEVPF
jgi:hypothetical protein